MPRDLPRVQPKSRQAWRVWLQKHHAAASGVWLVFAKKHTGMASVVYNDAVEEALCFGWIDSLLQPIDGDLYMQMFTPRKARSVWSASNKARVERLIDAGLMTPAGMKTIDLARENGTWDSLSRVESLTVPAELRKALDANAAAKKNWPAYTASARKQFLYYLHGAKRAETRAARVARIVDMVARKLTRAQMVAEATRSGRRTQSG